jgi:hypothetical protein
MERHMDNERKTGAGRAVEQAADDIDHGNGNRDTVPGAGPEITRHIARETPETSGDETTDHDAMEEDTADEDLEDEDDAVDEDEDEDADRGTPGYGDRGTTPV